MKRIACFLLPLVLAAVTQVSADDHHARRGDRNMSRRSGKIAMPVYAPNFQNKQPSEMTPEERARFEAARKRRFEIMMLIGAYKIMPEDQRQALKNELLKRIEADFHASIKLQKERIANAEAELKKLRAEVAEKEANSAKLIQSEMDRLLKMPVPGRRNHRKKNPPVKNNGK